MKLLLLGILSIALPVFAQHNHDHHHDNHAKPEVKRQSLSSKDKSVLSEILAKNDLLFNSFLKKDKDLIEKYAKELSALVSTADSSIVKQVKAKASSLNNIKSSNKNEDNLHAYESFLNPLITLVQQYDVGGKYNVFSCPMVKKSWIQDLKTNKDVKNVYAMDMLECGSQDTHF